MVNTTEVVKFITGRNSLYFIGGPSLSSLNLFTIVFKWVWICLGSFMLDKTSGEKNLMDEM